MSQTSAIRISVAPSATQKDIFIIRVDGSVDSMTADELDAVIGTLVRQERTRLIVDLLGAEYISSAGWGIFISRLREVRQNGGDLKLARMTPPVRDVYDLLELDGVLLHFDQLDSAESHFNGGNGHGHPAATMAVRPLMTEPVHIEAVPAALDDALKSLIQEDPFYSIGELRQRLATIRGERQGRWPVWRSLWGMGLLFRRQRFRYFRRQQRGHGRGL